MTTSAILLVLGAVLGYVGGQVVKGGKLRADQDSSAWWDPEAQNWVIRLTCGSFLFQGSPPLNVTWTTPQGEARFSSGYDEESGRFYLTLNSPVQGGNYTCAIPTQYLPLDCEEGQEGPDGVSASVEVNEIKARLTLAEANQNTLQEMVDDLERRYKEDLENVTLFCQDIEDSVDEQNEVIEELQSSVDGQGNGPPQNNSQEEAELRGACKDGMYRALNESWRSTANQLQDGEDYYCDDELEPGWYRFFLEGDNAVMPTSCVPEKHCQTHAPQWLDLQGQGLPAEVNEEREGRACAHWSEDCCNWHSPITVRNCGHFFLYHLTPRDTCHLAYCSEPQG